MGCSANIINPLHGIHQLPQVDIFPLDIPPNYYFFFFCGFSSFFLLSDRLLFFFCNGFFFIHRILFLKTILQQQKLLQDISDLMSVFDFILLLANHHWQNCIHVHNNTMSMVNKSIRSNVYMKLCEIYKHRSNLFNHLLNPKQS